ncbi:sensor histidine kinase [Dysgonomonas macrotermitis]|uniref:Histidine kinase n=1 Tax=Dysgonomonas macrotermitis TaxID=1346286 RepID=A0A1M4SM74_9BACT|nr:sensor histidine kinase [Dysgonomonas macrotermitis]SHE33262.1 Histidine kinase [Dysgonomonas macrotermitis]
MNQQLFIYKFLIDSKFRIWRHIFVTVFFILISFNQSVVTYQDIMPVLGNKGYGLIVLLTVLVFLATFNLTLYFFIPKYLLTGKYIRFTAVIILCAIIYTSIPNIVLASVYGKQYLFSMAAFFDYMSNLSVYTLAILGTIIPVFIKNWLLSRQRVNLLEKKQLSSQIEQLKEQVNPTSFFTILDRIGALVKTDPTRASSILMKLSKLLRYQLYDCNRKEVLLVAEINFLNNYLELERLSLPAFTYTITTKGDIQSVLIAPSILLPFIQCCTKDLEDVDKKGNLDIVIDVNKNITVSLTLPDKHDNDCLKEELRCVRDRLNLVYTNDQYHLDINREADNAVIKLTLNKE